jgi:low affinity Fe/Cu permease
MEPLITVLSVFAITMSQFLLRESNCDTVAIQKKLDELVKVNEKADDALIELEKKT